MALRSHRAFSKTAFWKTGLLQCMKLDNALGLAAPEVTVQRPLRGNSCAAALAPQFLCRSACTAVTVWQTLFHSAAVDLLWCSFCLLGSNLGCSNEIFQLPFGGNAVRKTNLQLKQKTHSTAPATQYLHHSTCNNGTIFALQYLQHFSRNMFCGLSPRLLVRQPMNLEFIICILQISGSNTKTQNRNEHHVCIVHAMTQWILNNFDLPTCILPWCGHSDKQVCFCFCVTRFNMCF